MVGPAGPSTPSTTSARTCKPRQVDHWIYFSTVSARERFVAEIVPLGFNVFETHDAAGPPNPFCAHLTRVDPVDLSSIHRVVMTLVAAAKRHAGEYDGWECPVETDH